MDLKETVRIDASQSENDVSWGPIATQLSPSPFSKTFGVADTPSTKIYSRDTAECWVILYYKFSK